MAQARRRVFEPAASAKRKSPLENRKSPREVWMDLKLDEGLKTLLESGREKGYLTYGQVNEYLPDDAVNPEKLDQLLLLLEEQGIELIDEGEAEEREGGTAAPEETREIELAFME